MKKLFNVLITFDVLVLADDAAEPSVVASEATYVPDGWDTNSLPLGDDDDALTIDKWIENGAAPLLKTQMDRRAKLASKVSR